MKLSNKTYDVLKWIVIIVLPALATLWVALAEVWGWPFCTEIAMSITAVETFLGAVLCISTANYNVENNTALNYVFTSDADETAKDGDGLASVVMELVINSDEGIDVEAEDEPTVLRNVIGEAEVGDAAVTNAVEEEAVVEVAADASDVTDAQQEVAAETTETVTKTKKTTKKKSTKKTTETTDGESQVAEESTDATTDEAADVKEDVSE